MVGPCYPRTGCLRLLHLSTCHCRCVSMYVSVCLCARTRRVVWCGVALRGVDGDCFVTRYKDQELQLAPILCEIRIPPPPFPCAAPLLDTVCLARLLQRLTPPTIVKCLGYLLNNFSIMLLSDDVRDLALCTEALRALVYPFELPHVYVSCASCFAPATIGRARGAFVLVHCVQHDNRAECS